MRLQERLDGGGDRLVRVVDGWYEVEEDGYHRPMPVLHYHGRSADGEYVHWSVHQYRPYFFVASADVDNGDLQALDADRRVLELRDAERTGVDRAETGIDLVKVVVEQPWHVGQLREEFDRTWEADVLFPQRYLIDRGITSYCRVPDEEGPLAPSVVTPADIDDVDAIEPRVAYWDIEVDASDGMPDPSAPRGEVTAVTLYDSYEQSYQGHVLRGDGDEWDEFADSESFADDGLLSVYDTERALLKGVVSWFRDTRPDILTGWNSNAFDWPYFANRCLYLDVTSVQRISPTGELDRHDDGGRFVNSDVGGIHLFDLMDGYKKSQYTELKSYSLEDVAAAETDIEKLDVDEQTAYEADPERFVEYNRRDVEACVKINDEINLL